MVISNNSNHVSHHHNLRANMCESIDSFYEWNDHFSSFNNIALSLWDSLVSLCGGCNKPLQHVVDIKAHAWLRSQVYWLYSANLMVIYADSEGRYAIWRVVRFPLTWRIYRSAGSSFKERRRGGNQEEAVLPTDHRRYMKKGNEIGERVVYCKTYW